MSALVMVDHESLKNFVRSVLSRVGFSVEDAEITADHLVHANLRGVETHGVMRLRDYINSIRRSLIKVCGDYVVERDEGPIVKVDCRWCLGIPVAYKLAKLAVERARRYGLSVIGCRNLAHVGMLGYYTAIMARERMIGFMMANVFPMVAPLGGAKPLFGTNPVSIAFPTSDSPIVIDMAMSSIPWGEVLVAASRGEGIPEGVAIDREGRVTTDPAKACALLPFGGHKGYALLLAVEVLAGILGGGVLSVQVPSFPGSQGGVLLGAVDPSKFLSYEEYITLVSSLIKEIKSSPRAPGVEEILIPGERGERTVKKRIREGIPLDSRTWDMLNDLAKELGLEPPKPKDA